MIAEPTSTGTGKLTGVVFAVVFMGLGSLLLWFMALKPAVLSMQSYHWAEVSCTVVRSELKRESGSDGDDMYRAIVNVHYEYDLFSHTGGSYSFDETSSSSRSHHANIVRDNPVGSERTCYANPDNLEQVVINRQIPGMVWFVGPFCLLFIVIGGFVLASAFGKTPARWAKKSYTPASRESEGLTDLKPRHTKIARLLATIFAAVLWNGITSFFVYQAVTPASGYDWFLLAFMVPFIAIGGVFVYATVNEILAAFNPIPVLRLSEGSPVLGQRVEMQWGFDGPVDRIQELSVVLEASEHATYEVGTNTTTDVNVFYSEPLVAENDGLSADGDFLSFELPTRSMHSFSANNNKIEWVIKLKADIRRWADIEEEYPIVVRPRGVSTV